MEFTDGPSKGTRKVLGKEDVYFSFPDTILDTDDGLSAYRGKFRIGLKLK